MPRIRFVSLIGVTAALSALQAQQYVISTYAGGPPATEPLLATNAAIGTVQGVAADAAGNVYFNGLNCVFKLDPRGALTRVAGTSYAGYSGDGGPAINAQVDTDNDEGGAYAGVAVDRAGNLYITDPFNLRVRRVSPDGTISTVAGDGTSGYSSGLLGDGGPATHARLSNPAGIAVDASGNLYIADPSDSRVRKISPDGIISTVAGDGTQGYSGDGAPATSAHLNWPIGVAVDGAGNLYIGDSGNNRIRRIDVNGIISTMAGDGTPASSGDGGPAAKAQLNYPAFVAVDPSGSLYITTSDRVRRISPDGVIATVAGDGTRGYSGDGGLAINAQLSYSLGVAADGNGNLYIADRLRLRKVSKAGVITTVAGNGMFYYGGDNGPVASAQIDIGGALGGGLAVDREGSLYLADTWNNRVRKVSPEGIITTVAGNGAEGYSGDGGPAINAQLLFPISVAVDRAGTLYIADTWNFRVRKVSKEGIITTVAGNGTQGHSGDGGDARNAQIGYPFGLAIGADGSVYIADILYVRKVAPDGVITTLAAFYAGAPAGSSVLDGNVLALAVDSAGNVYATDHIHDRVLKISPAGVITPYAGTGIRGFSGDGGPAGSAQLATPVALAVDGADNLYIGEWGSPRVRKVSAARIISTIAGTGSYGYTGDGGPATSAKIGIPYHLAAGEHGDVYVADSQNAIRLLQPVGPSVSINIIASGASFYSGPIAPGELVVIGGSGLGPATLVSAAPAADGSYPSQLAGVTVRVNGIAVPLVYASATAVAAIVPSSVSGETAKVMVTYQGQTSMPFSIRAAPAAPGIFIRDFSGDGTGPAAARNQDGSTNTPANPAKAGEVISLFATGLGRSGTPVSVKIGDEIAPAISSDTQSAGVAQVRVRVPDGVRAGAAVAVSLRAGNASSPEVTLAVK